MTFGKALAPVVAGCLAICGAQVARDQQTFSGCFRDALTVTAGSQPTVHAVGQQAVESATLHVNRTAGLRGVFFQYSLGAVRGSGSSAPSFAWQLDGGGWQPGTLSSDGSGTWTADPGELGDFDGGSTHSLQLAITFTSGDQAGAYSSDLQVGSFFCGGSGTDTPLSLDFAFASPSPTPSRTPTHSASPSPSASASVSPSPSASASPSPSDLVLLAPTHSQAPVAEIKAADSGNGDGIALVLAALVMMLALAMGFIPGVLRHRRLRGAEAGAGGEPGAGPGSGPKPV